MELHINISKGGEFVTAAGRTKKDRITTIEQLETQYQEYLEIYKPEQGYEIDLVIMKDKDGNYAGTVMNAHAKGGVQAVKDKLQIS